MAQNSFRKYDFTRKLVEFNLGKNDGYLGLDILRGKVDKVKFTTNKDPFYKNMLKTWSKLDVSHDLPIQSQYYYHNPNILGANGDTLPVYNCLEKLKIKQVKELSFKRDKAGYNREVYNSIKYIDSRVPDAHQTNSDLENHEVIYNYRIREEKHISKISTKAGLSQNGRESNCRPNFSADTRSSCVSSRTTVLLG